MANDSFVVVDTDVLIDASRGIAKAIGLLEDIGQIDSLSVSVVTLLELMVGCENKREFKKLNNFMSRFEILIYPKPFHQRPWVYLKNTA